MTAIMMLILTVAGAAMPQIEVHGHRGARALRPENTLAAFQYAMDAGADVLEMDLAVTKDDRVVVVHDLALNPHLCVGPAGERVKGRVPIRSLTLEELKTWDCGSLKNEAFPRQVPVPGQRIPTLAEVLALVQGTQVKLNLEMKSVPGRPELGPSPGRFAELVVGGLKKLPRDRFIIQSFDHRCLEAVKKLDRKIRISALLSKNLPDLVELARDLGAEFISPNQDWITKPDVEALHLAGVGVVPWTVNTPEDWDRMVGLGVDGIISDDPAGLIDHLKKRGLRE